MNQCRAVKLITPSSIGQLIVVYSHHYSVTVQLIGHKTSIAWWRTNQNDAMRVRRSYRRPLGTWSPTKYKPSTAKERPLRIIDVNYQSLASKKGAWRNLLEITKPDIIIATETWLNSSISDAELKCDDFIIYRARTELTAHMVVFSSQSTQW